MAGLVFPDHAREQMVRDSIVEDDVYTVVGDYDEMIERVTDGRVEYGRLLDDGRWVMVVIEHDRETVVSVWWDKQRSRRRRQRRNTRRR